MNLFALLLISFVAMPVAFASEFSKGFSPEELQWMGQENAKWAELEEQEPSLFTDPADPRSFRLLDMTDAVPFAEHEEAGYLIFSSHFHHESRQAKLTMARELPPGVDLIIYTGRTDAAHVQWILDTYSAHMDVSRLRIIFLPDASQGFWARDGLPVPVFRSGAGLDRAFTVVDAKYYHGFEPGDKVSQQFFSELTRHNYYFEGGNFVANSRNECLVVNTQSTARMPDFIFERHYGCKKLIRLPFIRGIGHADEVVKFIDDNRVLTDEERYVGTLQRAGFEVVRLPRSPRRFETYVNSLFVNGVAFVPVFGHSTDEQALGVYRSLGFKTHGLSSSALSNGGQGSIHCITMTYPHTPFRELVKAMGGIVLH